MRKPKQRKPLNDLSRSLTTLDVHHTLITVIEMGLKSWLVAGIVPGIERQPLKKLDTDENELLKLLDRWRVEAERAGQGIKRIAVAFEAGRDGFWLARWLGARGIEAYVIHSSSVAVSREHRRAKTDRLDTEHLKRAFLGWLRGERDHCKMAAIPTIVEEDAKRPNRERENLVGEQTRIVNPMKAVLVRLGIRGFNPKLKKAADCLEGLRTPEGEPIPSNTLAELRRDMERRRLVTDQIRQIEDARCERLEQAPNEGPNVMVNLLARVIGVGIETADMLVQEVLSRNLRDRRAVARYSGLTGSPDESGKKRREKGLARSGNARVRRGRIQLAWRFLLFQKDSALARWFRARTETANGARKTMIVALARKLLIALWQFVRNGVVPEGVALRPAKIVGDLKARTDGFGPVRARLRRVADNGSRWWCPDLIHGFEAANQNGSAASELRCRCATLHHGSGVEPTEYKAAARSFVRHAGSPRHRHRDPHERGDGRRPVKAIIRPDLGSMPPCSTK